MDLRPKLRSVLVSVKDTHFLFEIPLLNVLDAGHRELLTCSSSPALDLHGLQSDLPGVAMIGLPCYSVPLLGITARAGSKPNMPKAMVCLLAIHALTEGGLWGWSGSEQGKGGARLPHEDYALQEIDVKKTQHHFQRVMQPHLVLSDK